MNVIPKPHKLSAEEWERSSKAELSARVPARPVRSSLRDPVNRHSRVLKRLLDELLAQVKNKMTRVRAEKKVKYMGLLNSNEFLERLSKVKVTDRSVLITSDFRYLMMIGFNMSNNVFLICGSDAYTSLEHHMFYPAIRKLSSYCQWSKRKENLAVKLARFVAENCYMLLPDKVVRQDRG